MKERIAEIQKCLNNGLYEAALALALTLPDICAQVEYPGEKLVGKRYKDWFNKYVDPNVLYDEVLGTDIEPLTAEDIYKLRCSFLHSGNDDLQTTRIDLFHLLSPNKTKDEYGYRYGIKTNADGSKTYIAEIDIQYLSLMIYEAAEKYYQTKTPEEFEAHGFSIVI